MTLRWCKRPPETFSLALGTPSASSAGITRAGAIALVTLMMLSTPSTAQFAVHSPHRSAQAVQTAASGQPPHPSVVRIIVDDGQSESRGSGTLIGVDEQHGYVLTNWHVVRDAVGSIVVVFADGFQSAATVIDTDETWDLGLLMIWRPRVYPMPLATSAAQPGETLYIAGYGQGPFRAVPGRFVDYASPTPHDPPDMLEVSVAARQGDSGGPIVNERGELAGILFGAGDGRTIGTQVGRVRWFLDAAFQSTTPAAVVAAELASDSSQHDPATVGARQQPNPGTTLLRTDGEPEHHVGNSHPAANAVETNPTPLTTEDVVATIPAATAGEYLPSGTTRLGGSYVSSPEGSGLSELFGSTPWDQMKSFLAAIGILALVLRFLPITPPE